MMMQIKILPVDSVDASRSVSARIAVALIDIDLAIDSRSSRSAEAMIAVYAVLATSAELAWIALALVNLRLT